MKRLLKKDETLVESMEKNSSYLLLFAGGALLTLAVDLVFH